MLVEGGVLVGVVLVEEMGALVEVVAALEVVLVVLGVEDTGNTPPTLPLPPRLSFVRSSSSSSSASGEEVELEEEVGVSI